MNWPVAPEIWLLVMACGVLLADLFSTDPKSAAGRPSG